MVVRTLARIGLGARAVLYLTLGLLAIVVAAGHSSAETDQWGAMQQLNQSGGGHLLLWLVALGLGCYAAWRLCEAAFGFARDGSGAGARIRALASGILYAVLAASAFSIVLGDQSQSQASRQSEFTARVMAHAGGRVAVGVAGAAVAAVGLGLAFEGVSRHYLRQLDTGAMSRSMYRVVEVLGTIGTTARGIVFTAVGALVIDAAVAYSPTKAAGVDSALRTFRDAPEGPWLLGLVALGLVAFGLFGFLDARWHRMS